MGPPAWNVIRNNTFEDCENNCFGFKINNKLETMFLCSIHLSYYSPRLDPNKNYIGFMFGAINKRDRWFYNNGNDQNPHKKFM